MMGKKSWDITYRRTVSAKERKEKSQSSYLQLMNNIAEDLGVMLDDLCPAPSEDSPNSSLHFSNILVPTNAQSTNKHYNRGMFEPPSKNKSLNELQAERMGRMEPCNQSIDQMLSSGPVQTSHQFPSTFVMDPTLKNLRNETVPNKGSQSGQGILGLTTDFADNTLPDLSLEDRLNCTRDIWYQPEITKKVAIKALQSTKLGSFIFRGSRTKDQLSLSVHQNSEIGDYIENYPIQVYHNNSVKFLKSNELFESASSLVIKHMSVKGCLPILLRLPSPVLAAASRQQLQHLNTQATSVWRNSTLFHKQLQDTNQNITLEIPSESNKKMMRVNSTPQMNFTNEQNKEETENLIDLSNQLKISAIPMKRSSSYNEGSNPFRAMQPTPATKPLQQTLRFRPNSDNYFYIPHEKSKELQACLNPFQKSSSDTSHLPERDSGLPDNIREFQRLSASTTPDTTLSCFDPFEPRDSGVYPQHSRDSAISETGSFQTKSNSQFCRDSVISEFVHYKKSEEFIFQSMSDTTQTEPLVTDRHHKPSITHQCSQDSLDESCRLSGVSSASSGERFSLISTSSGEDSSKSISASTMVKKKSITNRIKGLKGALTSFSVKKKNKKEDKGNIERTNSEDVAEEAAETIKHMVLRRCHEDGILGSMTGEFIKSKLGKKNEKPEAMMHSIRQVIGGITRNLTTMNGDPDIGKVMKQRMHELNQPVERIIEDALYQRILVPLKDTIYSNYYHEYKNGSIALLEEKMNIARKQTNEELGIKSNFVPPNEKQMKEINECFSSLQDAISPYDKMDLILKAVMYIYDYVADNEQGRVVQSMGADDFLPMLIYTLAQCNTTTIEIETDYIWSLLEQTAFTGEAAYYLTTLTSAVHVLKNVEFEEETAADDVENEESVEEEIRCRSASISATKGFLEVVVTVSVRNFQEKMLPLWPGMTTKQICRNLTLKNHIEEKERENFGLFKLERNKEGRVIKETLLQDYECPQTVKNEMTHKKSCCDFGFKNKFFVVDWPVNNKYVVDTDTDESEDDSYM